MSDVDAAAAAKRLDEICSDTEWLTESDGEDRLVACRPSDIRWLLSDRAACCASDPSARQALERDAARYRWLRKKAVTTDFDGGWTGVYSLPVVRAWDHTPHSKQRGKGYDFRDGGLDAAIDAAMKRDGA